MSSVLELESTPEVQDLRKKVGDFLTEFIYPNEKFSIAMTTPRARR